MQRESLALFINPAVSNCFQLKEIFESLMNFYSYVYSYHGDILLNALFNRIMKEGIRVLLFLIKRRPLSLTFVR